MNNIGTLDQRPCGAGKTMIGIKRIIDMNLLNEVKTLVVVPSIKLQEEYKHAPGMFPQAFIINSEVGDETTSLQIMEAMEDKQDIIVITHAAFIRFNHVGFRSQYYLILDEAIEGVFAHHYINFESGKELATVNWSERFSANGNTKAHFDLNEDANWYPMTLVENDEINIIKESKTYVEITDPNFIHYMRLVDYIAMTNGSGEMHIMSELNPAILDGWHSLHIACASFENTKMYHWMNAKGMTLATTTPFTRHTGNIHIYCSHNPHFTWSKSKKDDYPEILTEFHVQVNQLKSGSIIALRNKKEKKKLNNEIKVTHNVHGQNTPEMKASCDVSCESALIPDNLSNNFMATKWMPLLNEQERKRAIKQMFMGHLFYQVIMRCILRTRTYNNERVNIFVLDQNTAQALAEYFDFTESHEIDFTSEAMKDKKQPKTSTQRSQERRLRLAQEKAALATSHSNTTI
jgi:hypothetical protein